MSVARSSATATAAPAAASEEALSPELVTRLRESCHLDEPDRARQNAVTHNEIDSLALNHSALAGRDRHFSHQVRTKGITDQRKSGTCWMFAALNTLRPHIIREHSMEEFEFSVAYLQFWDKLERANLYLEEIIALRDSDHLDRTWESVNRLALEDGGWWSFLVGLVEKYGLVPAEAMPETRASSETRTLNRVLRRLVQSRAARMLASHAEGAPVARLREMKREALAEVFRLLVICLGEPPAEFTWRFRRARRPTEDEPTDPRARDLAPAERFTPQSFRDRFTGGSLQEFVCLYHDPKNPMNRHYEFDRARNIAGTRPMDFVNVRPAVLKEVAISSILDNQPLWFAVNMDIDHSRPLGVMQDRLFDYETLFGLDLALDKASRTRFHTGMSNHAMALVGVDLDDRGRPLKWLVENSWGKDKGEEGRWILHDPWFDEHVYTLIAHRRHVPDEVLARFDDEPTTLPAWYPGAAGIV